VDELPRIAGDNRGAELRALVAEWKPAHKDERSFCAHAVAELFLLDPEAAGNDAARPFWDLYIRGLAYTADQPKTDVHPADNMGLAAVDIVLRAWAKAPEGR
jgi:hypothetical protein